MRYCSRQLRSMTGHDTTWQHHGRLLKTGKIKVVFFLTRHINFARCNVGLRLCVWNRNVEVFHTSGTFLKLRTAALRVLATYVLTWTSVFKSTSYKCVVNLVLLYIYRRLHLSLKSSRGAVVKAMNLGSSPAVMSYWWRREGHRSQYCSCAPEKSQLCT